MSFGTDGNWEENSITLCMPSHYMVDRESECELSTPTSHWALDTCLTRGSVEKDCSMYLAYLLNINIRCAGHYAKSGEG